MMNQLIRSKLTENRQYWQYLIRVNNTSLNWIHYNDVIMSVMASQITSLTIVYSAVHSGTDQRKQQSSASLAFVMGIHRWPMNSPHKGPVQRKMFPFDDVIMALGILTTWCCSLLSSHSLCWVFCGRVTHSIFIEARMNLWPDSLLLLSVGPWRANFNNMNRRQGTT